MQSFVVAACCKFKGNSVTTLVDPKLRSPNDLTMDGQIIEDGCWRYRLERTDFLIL